MISWYLPGGFQQPRVLDLLIEVYGSGGDSYSLFDLLLDNPSEGEVEVYRGRFPKLESRDFLKNILQTRITRGLRSSLMASNPLMSDQAVTDPKCKLYLDLFHQEGNSIFLSSDQWARSIREQYPKYTLIYSIVGCMMDHITNWKPFKILPYLEEKYRLYDLVTVPTHFLHQADILTALNRARTVFIINDSCSVHCERVDHYALISEHNLCMDESHHGTLNRCLTRGSVNNPIDSFNDIYHDRPEVLFGALDLGFRHFQFQHKIYSPLKLENDILTKLHWAFAWAKTSKERRGGSNNV